jgi:hypothetical protein
MKRLVFNRPRVDPRTGQQVLPQQTYVFSVKSDGYLDELNGINVPVNIGNSFIIKDNTSKINVIRPDRTGGVQTIEREYWVLVNPLSGDRKYIDALSIGFDVLPVREVSNNKNKVQTITAFDGSDLSNMENLDSGFDGFFTK